MKARITDLHRHAAREQTAKAAVGARGPQAQHRTSSVPADPVTGLARRVLTLAPPPPSVESMNGRRGAGHPLAVEPGRVPTATPHVSRLPPVREMPVSATLAANEALAAARARGQRVLPLAFGEAGLPVHQPALRAALAAATAANGYGPVDGLPATLSREPRPL
jgi:hypothetical protein